MARHQDGKIIKDLKQVTYMIFPRLSMKVILLLC